MKIHIEPHTLERAEERGTDRAEIIEVIETGLPVEAKYKRIGKSKIFNFQRQRLGKYYEQKRVEVFYNIENDEITTVTVYVFYGKWQ